MFEDIHKKGVVIKNQSRDDEGNIVVASRGRPRKPNMETVHIKLDKVLHAGVKRLARKIGVNKSALIAIALSSYMDKGEKTYRLIEA